MTTAETKTCPYCGEDILAATIKCKHCQSDLQTPVTAPNRKRNSTEYILWFIGAVVLFLIGLGNFFFDAHNHTITWYGLGIMGASVLLWLFFKKHL